MQNILPLHCHDAGAIAPYEGVQAVYTTGCCSTPVCHLDAICAWRVLGFGYQKLEQAVTLVEAVLLHCHPEVVYLIWRGVFFAPRNQSFAEF